MTEIGPVMLGTEAMAQLLAAAMAQSLEQATSIAALNLQLATSRISPAASPEGIGQLIDVTV